MEKRAGSREEERQPEADASRFSESKVAIVHRRLRDMAYRQGPNARLPTVEEMCASFAASRTTINDALEQLEAQHVILRRRGSGIYVSPRVFQKRLALAVQADLFRTDRASVFWDLLWTSFIRAAQARSETRAEEFTVHILRRQFGQERPIDGAFARLMEDRLVDGVLGVGLDYDMAEWLIARNVPVIAFAGLGSRHVMIDNQEFLRMGVRHLIDQGCRRIRLWLPGMPAVVRGNPVPPGNSPEDRSELAEQRGLFQEVLEAGGLRYEPELVWSFAETPHIPLTEQGYLAAERLIHMNLTAQTDGILCLNDFMTLGAMRALVRHRSADAIKVVSHANRDTAVLYAYHDRVARLEFAVADLVSQMFHLLDQALIDPAAPANDVFIGPAALVLPATGPY